MWRRRGSVLPFGGVTVEYARVVFHDLGDLFKGRRAGRSQYSGRPHCEALPPGGTARCWGCDSTLAERLG
jgi:hypothetical protein